jgi:flagellar hook-associated protein 2
MDEVDSAEGGTTLSDLASYINNQSLGVTASVLTDANGSRLSLVSNTSGADGDITVSSNSLTAAVSNTLGATVTVGASGVTSSAVLSAVASSSETLTGSLSVTVGSGTEQKITDAEVSAAEGGTTLTDWQTYIHANSSTLGVDASTVTNSDGTVSLQLTSNTTGTSGTLAVSSALDDSATSLAYTTSATGANASLTVDGVNLTSTSNTVTNLIPGVTMQLLATSSSSVQVEIGNYTSGVESTLDQFVSDYNSLVSAINTQEGNDSSGNSEPLYGSPTLTMLQQDILGGINATNPSGYLDSVSDDSTTSLTGSLSISVSGGSQTSITMEEVSSAEGGTTLTDLENYINSLSLGVTAGITTSDSESTLMLTSRTTGSSGELSVTSALTATDSGSSTALNYTATSDINSLASLGISVNDDGTISLDLTSLDSVLNSDFSGVQGLFQDANSWGTTFTNTLTNAGTSSTTGMLALALSSNSSTESTLNTEISNEETRISSEKASLTTELNSANEILQEIPSELDSVNELYSAITGYNQSSS